MTETQVNEVDALVTQVSAAFDRLHIDGVAGPNTLTSEEVEALYAAAHQLFRQGDLDRAAAMFNYLCVYENDDARFWMALAVTLQKQKKLDPATDAYSVAALLDATNIRPYFHATECLMESRQWDRAKKSLEAFLHICDSVYGDDMSQIQRFIDKAEIWQEIIQGKLAKQAT